MSVCSERDLCKLSECVRKLSTATRNCQVIADLCLKTPGQKRLSCITAKLCQLIVTMSLLVEQLVRLCLSGDTGTSKGLIAAQLWSQRVLEMSLQVLRVAQKTWRCVFSPNDSIAFFQFCEISYFKILNLSLMTIFSTFSTTILVSVFENLLTTISTLHLTNDIQKPGLDAQIEGNSLVTL